MIVIPAIDLRHGACVRLTQGDPDRQTVYDRDPSATAARFARSGATRLHVVDLDGAFAGHPVNLEAIKTITGAVTIPVEVGGGIRSGEDLEKVFACGAGWAILGTAVLDDLDFVAAAAREYPGRILVGLDARDGRVATRGWLETTGLTVIEAGRRVKDLGVSQVIYTDISRDGMLSGPNVTATRELARATGLSVIASGGVSGPDDIRALLAGKADGVAGVVVGKALYTGSLVLEEAIAIAQGRGAGDNA